MSCIIKIEKDYSIEDIDKLNSYIDFLVTKLQNSSGCGRLSLDERKSLYAVQNFVYEITASIREEIEE